MDAFAFLFGTLCGLYCLYQIFLKIRNKKKDEGNLIPKVVLLSMLYVGGITLFVLLFRGGSLFSLNRFVFAVPFVIVIWHYWINSEYSFSIKALAGIFSAITAFWLAFGSYGHIRTFLNFELVGLYSLFLFSVKAMNEMIQRWSLRLLVCINVVFQGILMVRFLTGEWVG